MQERKVSDDIAIVTMSLEELRQVVREEVARALGDRETLDKLCEQFRARMNATARFSYGQRNLEYKKDSREDLPDWARG